MRLLRLPTRGCNWRQGLRLGVSLETGLMSRQTVAVASTVGATTRSLLRSRNGIQHVSHHLVRALILLVPFSLALLAVEPVFI